MNRLIKCLSLALLITATALMGIVAYYDAALPESYYAQDAKGASLYCLFDVEVIPNGGAVEAAAGDPCELDASVKLFGVIPIKDAKIKKSQAPVLIPGGTPIGIKLLTDGVMVVKVQNVRDGVCPAKDAKLCEGDNIISANGEKLTSSARLSEIIQQSNGDEIILNVMRNGGVFTTSLRPIYSEPDGCYKGGLWIRDSSAGVGTLTFIDPETGCYGALGHPISDCDTQKTLPLGSGEIVDVTITGFEKGDKGCPGELFGTFVSGLASGSIDKNCEQGIFGKMIYSSRKDGIPIAYKTEVKTGPAKLITTINGANPQEFDVEIEKITLSPAAKTKNIVIKVTDEELLSLTGGIIQGMSGSPIIQDDKLVGAVTHVFVSDPTRGYGIFIENMLEAAEIPGYEAEKLAA